MKIPRKLEIKFKWNCFGFAFLSPMIQKNLHPSINQSDSKLKSIASWLTAFSRASGIHMVLLWVLIGPLLYKTLILIGCCEHFNLCFYDTQSGVENGHY